MFDPTIGGGQEEISPAVAIGRSRQRTPTTAVHRPHELQRVVGSEPMHTEGGEQVARSERIGEAGELGGVRPEVELKEGLRIGVVPDLDEPATQREQAIAQGSQGRHIRHRL